MPADIFVSHSSKDAKISREICAALEERGLTCWIAPRDIGPGQNFQETIVRAIRSARIMILVFSTNTNESGEVRKELVLASQNKLAVIPIRVEDVVPAEAFAYELSTRQWVDLFHDWDLEIGRVADQIGAILSGSDVVPASSPPSPSRRKKKQSSARSTAYLASVLGAILVLLVAGVGAIYAIQHGLVGGLGREAPATPSEPLVLGPTGQGVTHGATVSAGDLPTSQGLSDANAAYERKDYAEASRDYLAAATANDAQAQYQLGYMYQLGQGVPQDYASAARWYGMAAGQGLKNAQLQLGYLAQNGLGVPKSYATALHWYQLAAAQGSAPAQNQLGYLYQMGYGVPVNYPEALRWYQSAAAQGSAPAQFRIGHFYAEGLGVPRDLSAARDWMNRAAAGGNQDARTWLAMH